MGYYFAFGSNMARATLVERGVDARRIGAGYVSDYRLAFTLPSQRWTGRAADLLAHPGRKAWGVVWELADPMALDPFELRYDRRDISVTRSGNQIESGRPFTAFTYMVKPENRAEEEALPAPAYLDRMLDGAGDADVPLSYLRFLEGFRTA